MGTANLEGSGLPAGPLLADFTSWASLLSLLLFCYHLSLPSSHLVFLPDGLHVWESPPEKTTYETFLEVV